MDETTMQTSLTSYRQQLEQIETAIQSCPADLSEELVKLADDLKQVIELTEGSLLSLKKCHLLCMLDGQTSLPQPPTIKEPSPSGSQHHMDDEFAAFQAAIADSPGPSASPIEQERQAPIIADSAVSQSPTPLAANHTSCPVAGVQNNLEESSDVTARTDAEPLSDFNDFIGMRCRAPFSHAWGQHRYHNAMVASVEPTDEDSPPQVRVLFSNPTHRSLLPCPYFLENRCNFGDECRFSHGHLVDVEALDNYEEPDFSGLKLGSSCLAKDDDGLWYEATIVEVLPAHRYQVMFDSNEQTRTIDIDDLLPPEQSQDGESEDSDCDLHNQHASDSEEETDQLPAFLCKPQQTSVVVGDWESHTRGIASKLMAKMGYVAGQGLGKGGQGRSEPIPIQLLPQGKSLDKIMQLKAVAGDKDLYDVLKKQKRKEKQLEKKSEANYIAAVHNDRANVFQFLNKKLSGKKGNLKDLIKHEQQPSNRAKNIGERELKAKSDRQVNVQLLKTHEEMRKVREEKLKIQRSLERHEGRDRDPTVVKRLQEKMRSLDQYLDNLNRSERSIEMHQQRRSDHKKLTVF